MDDCVTNCCEFVKVSADLVIDCRRYAQEVSGPAMRPFHEAVGTVNFATRYFLRRLAKARRDPRNYARGVAYSEAMAESILIFVGLPGMALFSWIVIAGLKHSSPTSGMEPRSIGVSAVILTVLLMLGGYLLFRRRFAPYAGDSTAYLDFDSQIDRDIIFWQKLSMTALCEIVLPWIAILLFLVL